MCLWLSLTACAWAQDSDGATEAARVGDIVVTLDDLDDAWQQNDAASRMRLLQQVYETRRRTLDIVIGEHLIEREATQRGMTRSELLEAELPSRTRPVTDEEIDRIYERNRNAFQDRTLEQMRPEIRAVIEQQRPSDALHQFMRELRAGAVDVAVLLEPPRQKIEILADDPSRGPEDAPIVLVEFPIFSVRTASVRPQPWTNCSTDTKDRFVSSTRTIHSPAMPTRSRRPRQVIARMSKGCSGSSTTSCSPIRTHSMWNR